MSLRTQDTPQLPSLDDTLGAWLIGTFAGAILQGMVVFQTYRYFYLYPKDALYLKLWVLSILVIETLNTALTMHASYVYLVSNFFNPAIFEGPLVRSMAILPIPGTLAAIVSQCFFARRVYMLGRRRFRFIVVVAMLCYLLFIGFYFAIPVKALQSANLTESLKYSWLASVGSCLVMAGDFMLTAVLVYLLRVSRTGMTRTDSLLDTLIHYAIGTGLLICVFNVLNVVFALAFPDNLIYTAISIIVTKLYANSFLVALNMRDALGNQGSTGTADTSPFRSTLLRDSRLPNSRTKRGTLRFGFSNTSSAERPDPAIELKMMPGLSRDIAIDEIKTEHRAEDSSTALAAP